MKLEKFTTKQEQKMLEVKQYWLDYIFSCKNSINREKAKIQIEWLYKFCGRDKPVIIYLDSPMACQLGVHFLKQIFKGAQVGDQVGDQVWDQVGAQVGDQVWDQVWDQVIETVAFCSYGSIYDYGWVSFFDFFTQIGVVNHKGFDEFKSLIQSGIYDTIQLNGFCIVSELPKMIKRNAQNRLHCEDGPAIVFPDGYAQYYWKGLAIPGWWITNKEKITKEVIKKENNAEKRRCLRDIIGPNEYFKILGGVIEIDRDTDGQGNEMILYRSKLKDDVIGKYIQYLSVICPSTKREYLLYPPNQQSTNVWSAKASTFQNEKVQYRHGDVALLNLNKTFDRPFIES